MAQDGQDRRLEYRAGLDGVRAIAIVAVLLFHGGFDVARGGFLGVSLFFTLSGFLVTSLLLAEHGTAGRIRLGAFWERRARRLLPAALATIAAALYITAHIGDTGQRTGLRGDALSAVGYVANWHFIVGGDSYGDLFQAPSPLLHYWSLAIEEQLYLVVPLVVAGALRLGRGRHAVVGGALALLALSSTVVSWALAGSVDRVYFGTDTRAAELLIGAVLAVAWTHPPTQRMVSRGAAWLALPVMIGFAVLVHVARADDRWLRTGGFSAIALGSALLVAAAASDTRIARALSLAPLRLVGRISYTVYLVHWPVFVFLDSRRASVDGVRLFALRLAITLAISLGVYHLLECPIRFGRRLVRRRALVGAAAIASASIVVAASVAAVPESPAYTVTAGPQVIDAASLEPVEHEPINVAIVGDGAAALATSLRGDPLVDVVHVATGTAPEAWVPAPGTRPDLLVIAQRRADERTATQAACEQIVRSLRDHGVLVAWVPPGGDGARARAARDVVHALADRELGTVALAAPVDGAAVVHAHRDAAGELRRAWPRPLGSRAPAPMRLLVVGDSTSHFVAVGLEAAGRARGDLVVAWAGSLACPFLPIEAFRDPKGYEFHPERCPPYESWAPAADAFEADAVLVVTSVLDAAELQRVDGAPFEGFGETALDDYFLQHAANAVELLAPTGAVVLWADGATIRLPDASVTGEWNARLARYNELVAELDTRFDHVVRIALAARLGVPGSEVDLAQRPDGVHLTPDAATAAANTWLAGDVVGAWRTAVRTASGSGCLTGAGPRPTVDLRRCHRDDRVPRDH